MLYNIITYGCQMNVHESEKLAGILGSKGYKPTDRPEDADVVVFNTCCVRETAQARALGHVAALKKLKIQKPDMLIVVAGCIPQQKGVGDMIFDKYPHVDIVLGTHNLHHFAEILEQQKTDKRIKDICDTGEIKPKDTPIARSGRCNAFVNIIYGCDNYCTYCIVPYVRGREKSRPMDDIIAEVSDLVINQGFPEITLLGQNVNSYGNDLGGGVNFAALLNEICKIDKEFRLKFITSHPKDFSLDIVKVIAQNPKISKLIHLPFQSGSNDILKKMNRRYTREAYLEKIEWLRSHIPDVGLSSDVIVGFPGETEEDFEQTLDLVTKVRFNNLYMFAYSPRKGTAAENMQGQLDAATKKARLRRLIDIQRKITAEIAAASVGNVYRVLFEDIKDDDLIATSDCGKLIYITGCQNQSLIGKFGNVKATANKSGRLIGEIL